MFLYTFLHFIFGSMQSTGHRIGRFSLWLSQKTTPAISSRFAFVSHCWSLSPHAWSLSSFFPAALSSRLSLIYSSSSPRRCRLDGGQNEPHPSHFTSIVFLPDWGRRGVPMAAHSIMIISVYIWTWISISPVPSREDWTVDRIDEQWFRTEAAAPF